MKLNLKICPETPSDYLAISQIHTLAFGQDNEAKLVDRIRASDRYIRDLSLVAKMHNLVVGHILFSQVDLVGKNRSRVLALAPLAVLPAWQNQGIGSALVSESLKIAEGRSEAFIIVLGHPQFYPKFGFKPASFYGIECSFSVPDEAFMAKPLTHRSEVDRATVIYPETFAGV